MSIFGGSFAQLRRQLGLLDTPRTNAFPTDMGSLGKIGEGSEGIGTDYLRSNEGADALYNLYSSGYDLSNPQMSRLIKGNRKRIEDAYGAAAAYDPTLQRDQFLAAYDPLHALYKQLTPFERGERPGAYSGRHRVLNA